MTKRARRPIPHDTVGAICTLATAVALTGCYTGWAGDLDQEEEEGPASTGADGGSDDGNRAGSEPEARDVPVSGMRRLTAAEYDATVMSLLGVPVASALLLPEDPRTPYDNDYTLQQPSDALVSGAELLAGDLAALALSTEEGRDRVVGCTPNGAADEACFEQFVVDFGKRALRRPLTEEQRLAFTSLHAISIEEGDFYAGVETAVRAFLQHPQFLYRVEVGTPVENQPGLFALDDWEVASRLSYVLWGTMPDQPLFDAAETGELGQTATLTELVRWMLEDDRASTRVQRFHALWLDFEQLPHSAELSAALNMETSALIERVVFEERRPWLDLLTSAETHLDAMLAEHYGLPAPNGDEAGWVPYPEGSGRKGLLSHGSFLSLGGAFGDTSPTLRGIAVRTRLFCEPELQVPEDVDPDNAPQSEESPCKWDRYAAHRADPGCASCHAAIDPIGFGLENYGPDGRFRTHDVDLPQCEILGEGEVPGIGTFSGPGELADLVIEDGRIERCVATQFYRFAMGRFELDQTDKTFIDALMQGVDEDAPLVFDQMVISLLTSPEFRFRRDEDTEE
jgi:hypothetical protein